MHRVGDGGEKSNAARHEVILVGFETGFRQERPHVLHERLEESLELLLVLLDVQVDVVADGRLDAIDRNPPCRRPSPPPPRAVLVRQIVVKFTHPRVHVVLEHLRKFLTVQAVKDATDEAHAVEQGLEQRDVPGVGLDRPRRLGEQRLQRSDERVEDVLELAVQLIGFVRLAVSLENGVGGSEHADDGWKSRAPGVPMRWTSSGSNPGHCRGSRRRR